MMKLTRIVVLAAAALSFGYADVQAQTTSGSAVPAEFPPASFTGKQYVDSNGCIFIRAGVSGNVTWVPRVGRDRKQICGYQPSAQTTSAAAVPAPRTVVPAPVEIVPDTTPSAVTAPAPAPVASPTVTVAAPATPSATNKAATVKTATAHSARTVTRPVRDTTGYIRAINASTGETVLLPPDTRVVPRHVYENRRYSKNVQVPKGYRAGWRDDRLNTHRGEQTLKGRAQMNVIWTNTVPRRLVEVSSGQQVSSAPVVYETQARQIGGVQPAVSTQSNATHRAPTAQPVNRAGRSDNLR